MATAPSVFDSEIALPGDSVSVDLAAVTFIDAFALGALVRLRNAVLARGGEFFLNGVPPQIARVFRLGGLSEIL